MTSTFRFDPILPEGEVATLRRGLEAAGWRETFERNWTLYWDGSLPDAEFFASLKRDQWINHFPGYGVFGDKGHLNDNLARRWAPEGRFRRIHPRGFSMPGDYGRWREAAAADPGQLWLLKPRRLSQGRDIELVRDLDAVPRSPKWMIQEYVQRPHLLDGYKYVLRCYVLLTSLDPLLCYLHRAGVCKRTSRPFTLDPDSLNDRFVHLTNPAIQRHNVEVAWGALNADHVAYRARLREEGIDDDRLFAEIREILVQTVIACREEALLRSRAVSRSLETCFELIGVDLIVDEDLRPWVLECNPSPALEVGPGYDADAARLVAGAKEAVLFDMVSLLGGSMRADRRASHEAYWRERAALELAAAGGYERIWPAADADRFVPHFPLLRPLDGALAADACPGVPAAPPAVRPADRVTAHSLGDGVVLFDPDQRRFYAVNAAGAATWLALADGLPVSRAVDELAAASPGVDPETVEEAVWDLLVAWAQRGLLAGFEPSGQAASAAATDTPIRVAGERRGDVLILSMGPGDGGDEPGIELPDPDVRRLVLIGPGSDSGSRLAIGHPAAALDALVAVPGVRNALDPSRAASLVAWLAGLEIFDLEVGGGEPQQASRLLELVCRPALIKPKGPT